MNQTEANALLASIVSYASLASDTNFTLHASEGVHMSKTLAAARAVSDKSKLCGYFQHTVMETVTVRTDSEGYTLPKPQKISRPTKHSEDVNGVEYLRLIKAFFRSGSVTATPSTASSTLATMKGPIPAGFTGYTNTLGTATYTAVTNMQAIVSKGSNWQLVTIYPVA